MWKINLTETRGNLISAIARRCPQQIFISDPSDTKLYTLVFTGFATCDEIIAEIKKIKENEIENQTLILRETK